MVGCCSRWRPPHFEFPEMLPPSWIYKKCYYGPLVTFVFTVFISTQIWSKFVKIGKDIPFVYFQNGDRRYLEFPKSAILDPYIADIYQHTKFGAYWSRIMADICPFVFFPEWHFGPLMTLVSTVPINIPNLVQIDQELAEIYPFVYFSRWRPPPSWISKKCYF